MDYTPEGTDTKFIRHHDLPKNRRRNILLRSSNVKFVSIDEAGEIFLIYTCERHKRWSFTMLGQQQRTSSPFHWNESESECESGWVGGEFTLEMGI